MTPEQILTFAPVDHPNDRIRRVGFDLEHPYVEQCWTSVIGPSSTLLLRRIPTLWIDAVPASISAGDLSRSLGLGERVGDRGRFTATMQRVVQFGLLRPSLDGPFSFDVNRQIGPLSDRQLDRLPAWTRTAHERLWNAHTRTLGDPGPPATPSAVTSITARLDQLQHRHLTHPHTNGHDLPA